MADPSQILNAIPDGGSISFAAFQQAVGNIANFISFASPQTLARKGPHVTVTCAGAGTYKSPGGITVKTDPTIEFDCVIKPVDVIVTTNVVGIHLSSGVFGGTLKNVTVTPLAGGKYQVDGTVDVGFPVGNINFSKTIDSQGNIA
jgi:hypothetical protein